MNYTYRNKKFTAVFTDEDGYFSLTGDCDGGSGACGDSIAKIDSRFKLLDDMHLSDAITGEPMHAEANGMYFAEQIIKKTSGYDIDTVMRHLRIDHDRAIEFVELVREHNDMSKAGVLRASESAQAKLAEMFIKLRIQWKKEAEEVRLTAYDLYKSYQDGCYHPENEDDDDDDSDEDDDDAFDWGLCDQPEKVKALSEYLECHPDDITEDGNNIFKAHGRDYLVVDDDEADDAWDEELEHYIDECLEIPEAMMNYFDKFAWKRDARMDGRGHALGRYDGHEYDVTTQYDTQEYTFYIYRQ